MSTNLQSVLADRDYKNWLMAGLSLKYARQGILNLVKNDTDKFYQDVLKSLAGSQCNRCEIINIRGVFSISCPNSVCDKIFAAISNEHRFKPTWKNTDCRMWCSDSWQFAKCFMSVGYASKVSAADTDLPGLLNTIINNRRFDNLVNDNMGNKSNIFCQSRDVRNRILHTADMRITDTELADYIQILQTMLSNPKCSTTDPDIQEAKTRITEMLNDSLFVTSKDEAEILAEEFRAIEEIRLRALLAIDKSKEEAEIAIKQTADDACLESQKALAIAKAMVVWSLDPPTPIVPGLTPMNSEEVITIHIQPNDSDEVDCNSTSPIYYFENIHWVRDQELGRGAYGTCYKVRDVGTDTIMALKQISFYHNSETEQDKVIKKITKEITIMSKLNHPHTVRLIGATRQGCHFNMFVEWMAGGSVSYQLGKRGAFSEDVITNYVLQILRGLAYLHENQILHRDLKGDNLLIDSTGQRLRICDFGEAAKLAFKRTRSGEFKGQLQGTIAFMAPEVLRGETYGRACDVWSVGCCVIEMATAKPPWDTYDISNLFALMYKIGSSETTPPVPENLSPLVLNLLSQCLQRTKEQRPTAKELLIHPLFT